MSKSYLGKLYHSFQEFCRSPKELSAVYIRTFAVLSEDKNLQEQVWRVTVLYKRKLKSRSER